jgi:peptidase C25-like protein/flagellar hook capping protein FlgD
MIQPRGIFRAIVPLLLLVPAATARGTAPAKTPSYDIELLESTARQIRFQVHFTPPVWKVDDQKHLKYPDWPGLTRIATPGEAAIGAALARIALPPDGRVTLEESPRNGERVSGVVFPPAAVPPAEDAAFGVKSLTKEPDVPLHHARVVRLGVERGLRTALIAVGPVRRAGDGSRDIFWAETIEVTVQITGGAARARAVSSAIALQDLDVLNPGSVPVFVQSVRAAKAMPSVWFDDGAGWLKIRVAKNGIYTLTRDSLVSAGVPVSSIDPRTFRLFSGPLVPELAWTTLGWRDTVSFGDTTQVANWYHVSERPGFTTGFGEAGGMEENDLWVDGEGDGVLGASDRVVFYGLGPDNYRDRFGLPPAGEEYFENPYSDYTVYWLTWGGSFPGSAHRMSAADVTPPNGSTPLTETTARIHAEQNTIYAPSLVAGGLRYETWFWDIVTSQASLYRALVNLPNLVPGTTMSGRVRLWGGNQPEGATSDQLLHHVQVDINSVSLPTFQWGGPTVYEALTPKDIDFSGVTASGTSRFEFRVPALTTGRIDIQYVAWIDVHYRRTLALGNASGEVEVEPGVSDRVVHIAQVPSGTLDVFDVTNFRHPRLLTGAASVATVTGPGIELAVNDSGPVVIAVATRTAPQSPTSILLDDAPGSWLRDTTQGLDEVIIAHDDFASEGERLAERRRATLANGNGRVRVVNVSDVMDEFAWGMWDPIALRYFLEYAYRYYPGTTLSYAVFLGDHTYDFRNYLGTGNRDLVPSWEDNRDDLGQLDTGSVQYASDDPFVLFDGPADPFIDVAIGRIPVSTVAGARAVIEDKILRSEEQPVYGSWRARILIGTDDLCQSGNIDPVGPDILAAAEQVDQGLPPAYDRKKIYATEYGTACTITSKPQASDDFIAQWNAGAWLVNYLGHGTETFYADERLLQSSDVPSLTNLDRLPLLIASASKSAKYNLPNQTSITEALAISPAGGALAATGSVSNQTFSDVTFDLNRHFVDELFAPDSSIVPAGLAFLRAKNQTAGDTKKYVFFGDPAGVPPAARLTSLTLSGPSSLARGVLAQVSAHLAVPGTNWLLELRGEDAKRHQSLGYALPGDLMYQGNFQFVADSVNAAFVVPISAREGPDARIRAYAWTDNADALAAIDPVTISGEVASLDTEGPAVIFDNHPADMVIGQNLGVIIEDPSGILLVMSGQPALTLIVLDEQNNEITRVPLTDQFQYDLGSHTKGTAHFPVPPGLANGTYTFKVVASDNFGNPTSATTTVHVTTSAGPVSFTSVYAYPNPLSSDTDVVFTLDRDVEVTLRIYSVSGRLVQKTTMPAASGRNGYHWDGRDQAGDPVANGVYLLQLSAPGNGDPVKYLERLVVLR